RFLFLSAGYAATRPPRAIPPEGGGGGEEREARTETTSARRLAPDRHEAPWNRGRDPPSSADRGLLPIPIRPPLQPHAPCVAVRGHFALGRRTDRSRGDPDPGQGSAHIDREVAGFALSRVRSDKGFGGGDRFRRQRGVYDGEGRFFRVACDDIGKDRHRELIGDREPECDLHVAGRFSGLAGQSVLDGPDGEHGVNRVTDGGGLGEVELGRTRARRTLGTLGSLGSRRAGGALQSDRALRSGRTDRPTGTAVGALLLAVVTARTLDVLR